MKEDAILSLVEAFETLHQQARVGVQVVGTAELAAACEKLFPLFDHLGPVFAFAAEDFKHKTRDIAQASVEFPTVDCIVRYGVETGTLRTKNGRPRNLQGLKNGCRFVHVLFCKMIDGPDLKLSRAALEAYRIALEPYHILPVKLAVKAGIYALPSRDAFLDRLGETEASAMSKFRLFVEKSALLIEQMEKLYDQAVLDMKGRA